MIAGETSLAYDEVVTISLVSTLTIVCYDNQVIQTSILLLIFDIS